MPFIATAEDAARFKNEVWGDFGDDQFRGVPADRIIVAEGDSWFDYPLNLDILDHLKRAHGYRIKKFARYGDTAYNMAFGPHLGDVTHAIARFNPAIVLLSAGGNDVAGPPLLRYLNPSQPGNLDAAFLRTMLSVFRIAYEHIIERALAANGSVRIIAHGYAHPIPDGRGFRVAGLGFAGPWLKPYLDARGIRDAAAARGVLRLLIDGFNGLLAELARQHPRFHYLDLRPHIRDPDWANELHLTNAAFRRVADLFHAEIRRLV